MSMLVSLMLLQAAATAPETAVSPATPSDDKKVVCKTIRETGSRLGGKRECRTKEEWARIEQENQQKARNNMGR